MTTAEILGEIRALPFPEQSRIYEVLKDIVLRGVASPSHHAKSNELARAAQALRSDYQSDAELTAFTALDGEDFHASR